MLSHAHQDFPIYTLLEYLEGYIYFPYQQFSRVISLADVVTCLMVGEVFQSGASASEDGDGTDGCQDAGHCRR